MTRNKLKSLLDAPGVYFFKDASGEIIYIGKASSLKKRVTSYFHKSRPYSPRLEILVSKIKDIEYTTTGSEAEALIMEAQLIKEHKPRYNVELKDDKSYPFLKLTLNEKYPRLFIARRRLNDGARYFGPFTEVKLLRKALEIMRRVFPLRTCRTIPKQLCLMFHLKMCLGPCEKLISEKDYNGIVEEALLFLEGKRTRLIELLSEKMLKASKDKNFEEAARIRDKLNALSAVVMSKGERVSDLKEALKLSRVPVRIEAFDISNIFGKWAVGSMVSFLKGEPDKSCYRRFKIKTVEAIDDYKMIKEVVRRRYTGSLKDKLKLPDLILIDGGKGHLSVAEAELKAIGLGHIDIASIAKEHEEIFVPHKRLPIRLPKSSSALRLIQRIRNESHRFAITYHRKLRSKALLENG